VEVPATTLYSRWYIAKEQKQAVIEIIIEIV
jgi:hypothetical protein